MTRPALSQVRMWAVLAGTLAATLVLSGCTDSIEVAEDATAETTVADADGNAAADDEAEVEDAAADAAPTDAGVDDEAATEPDGEATTEAEADATDDAEATDAHEDDGGAGLVPEAEGTVEYPLTLTTWLGESVLEERPDRVAVIGFSSNLDTLEALDVTPVYAVDVEEWDWNDPEWVAQIEFQDTSTRADPINFEAIAATTPDVIVATNSIIDPEDYERLSEIAAVIDNPEQVDGDKFSWQENQRLVGEALDLTAAADQVVADAEEAVAAIAADHPELDGRTSTIAYDYGPEWGTEYYTVAGGTAERVMLELGFEPNPLAEEFAGDATVSDESQALLDADLLVMFHGDEDVREARESDPLFRAIPAVAEGRYVSLAFNDDADLVSAEGTVIPNIVWVLRRGASALSVPWVVDVIANQALAEVDLS